MSLMLKILDEVKKKTSTCRRGMHALACRGSQQFGKAFRKLAAV
jgi:hypothetical protein